MTFIGQHHKVYADVLFVIFAVISAACCITQLNFLKSLQTTAVYLLPFLSFCICYENVILYYGDEIDSKSMTANFANIFHALQIPLFCTIEFELVFRLHEARSAHFCCVRFDQGQDSASVTATITFLTMRLISISLFIINVLVNYRLLGNLKYHEVTGRGGYITLSHNSDSLYLWLNLIPPIILSMLSFYISLVLYRYGNNITLSFGYNRLWRLIIPCSLCQAIGQIFGSDVYPVTSNAGELALLIGVTTTLFLIKQDLVLAGSFASYLHRSNIAFNQPPEHYEKNSSLSKENTFFDSILVSFNSTREVRFEGGNNKDRERGGPPTSPGRKPLSPVAESKNTASSPPPPPAPPILMKLSDIKHDQSPHRNSSSSSSTEIVNRGNNSSIIEAEQKVI